MTEETTVIQMVRVLPLVETIHREARVAVSGGMGIEAADYCVERHNIYAKRIRELTQDDLLDGLILTLQDGLSNEKKMQHVMMAAAELQAYLRQRIGIVVDNQASAIGTVINQWGNSDKQRHSDE